MKKYILLILAIPILFSSCSDEEPSPEARIAGIYERIIQGNEEWGSNLYDFVSTLQFSNDGTFTMDEVTKDIGGDIVLGYRSYGNGTYTIVEDELTIVYDELYVLGVADRNYLPKDELRLLQALTSPFDNFKIIEDYKTLTSGGCGPNQNCVVLNYNRME